MKTDLEQLQRLSGATAETEALAEPHERRPP
jgi:hypothetical protein